MAFCITLSIASMRDFKSTLLIVRMFSYSLMASHYFLNAPAITGLRSAVDTDEYLLPQGADYANPRRQIAAARRLLWSGQMIGSALICRV